MRRQDREDVRVSALKDALAKWVYVEAKVLDLGGRGKTRLTAPVCFEVEKFGKSNCEHAHGYHDVSGINNAAELRHWGLTYAKRTGELRFPKPKRMTFNGTIPPKTLENIAACAAVGLAYWSDHPKPGFIWAVDTNQTAHAVEVDRNKGTARHACYVWTHDASVNCTHTTQGQSAEWAKSETMAELMSAMELPFGITAPEMSPIEADDHIDELVAGARAVEATREHNKNPFRLGPPKKLPVLESEIEKVFRPPGTKRAKPTKTPRSKTAKTPPAADPLGAARITAANVEFGMDDITWIDTDDLLHVYRLSDQIDMDDEVENRIGAELDRRGVELPA
jgi:hypothetical protein